jgi:hypothetical protein
MYEETLFGRQMRETRTRDQITKNTIDQFPKDANSKPEVE